MVPVKGKVVQKKSHPVDPPVHYITAMLSLQHYCFIISASHENRAPPLSAQVRARCLGSVTSGHGWRFLDRETMVMISPEIILGSVPEQTTSWGSEKGTRGNAGGRTQQRSEGSGQREIGRKER